MAAVWLVVYSSERAWVVGWEESTWVKTRLVHLSFGNLNIATAMIEWLPPQVFMVFPSLRRITLRLNFSFETSWSAISSQCIEKKGKGNLLHSFIAYCTYLIIGLINPPNNWRSIICGTTGICPAITITWR